MTSWIIRRSRQGPERCTAAEEHHTVRDQEHVETTRGAGTFSRLTQWIKELFQLNQRWLWKKTNQDRVDELYLIFMLSSEAIWLHFSKKLLLLVNVYVRLKIKNSLCANRKQKIAHFFYIRYIKLCMFMGLKLSHCGSRTENCKEMENNELIYYKSPT